MMIMTSFSMFMMVLIFMNEEKLFCFFFWFIMSESSLSMMSLFFLFTFMSFSLYNYNKGENYYNIGMVMIKFCCFSMIMTFLVKESFMFLFFYELCMIPVIYLILMLGKNKDKFKSSIMMYSMNMMFTMPHMLSTIYLINSMNSSCFLLWYNTLMMFNTSLFYMMVNFMFLVKMPLLIFHMWLSMAHVSASMMGSMILAAMMLKMSGMGMEKYSYMMNYNNKIMIMLTFIFMISVILVVMMMVSLYDLKYLIAMSSVHHMSFIPLSILFKNIMMYKFLMMMMSFHGYVSMMMFMYISKLYELSMSRSMYFSKSFHSLSKKFFFLMVMLFLINLGFPPFIGFFTEIIIMINLYKFSFIMMMLFLLSYFLCIFIFTTFFMKMIMGKYNYFNYMIMKMNYLQLYNMFLIMCVLLSFMF